ncbi:nuclear transport factor 2 family protein [Pseudonocardia sp. NPDC049635]|uniref:nuclear transport factor 2 family protein n=1 Tax=Pseudonocardia sp. NPDC049635 TaxID=3155506 RepID=UPI0033CD2324
MTVPDPNDSDPIESLAVAINAHDPRRIAACFTEDYRAETPHRPAEGFVGSDRVHANWTAILARLPDLRARVLRRATAGPELWSEWDMTGTGPDGGAVVLCGPVIMTTRDGRIDRARFYLSAVTDPGPAVADDRRGLAASSPGDEPEAGGR